MKINTAHQTVMALFAQLNQERYYAEMLRVPVTEEKIRLILKSLEIVPKTGYVQALLSYVNWNEEEETVEEILDQVLAMEDSPEKIFEEQLKSFAPSLSYAQTWRLRREGREKGEQIAGAVNDRLSNQIALEGKVSDLFSQSSRVLDFLSGLTEVDKLLLSLKEILDHLRTLYSNVADPGSLLSFHVRYVDSNHYEFTVFPDAPPVPTIAKKAMSKPDRIISGLPGVGTDEYTAFCATNDSAKRHIVSTLNRANGERYICSVRVDTFLGNYLGKLNLKDNRSLVELTQLIADSLVENGLSCMYQVFVSERNGKYKIYFHSLDAYTF